MKAAKYTVILEYSNDGTYLSLLPLDDSKRSYTKDELISYIFKKNLQDVDIDLVYKLFDSEEKTKSLIAPPQLEHYIDDDFEIKIDKDNMTAYGTLFVGDEKGNRIAPFQVIDMMKHKYNISNGICHKNIEDIILNKLDRQEVIIAKGTQPTVGKNGSIELFFEIHDENLFKVDEFDRVDYKELNLFTSIQKGKKIAGKIPAMQGVDGVDIFGKEIKAKPVKEAKFVYGKGVLESSDGEFLIASTDGRIDVVGNKIVVSKVYIIKENVDMSVGNITFDGDVIVCGNVLTGFSIKAGGGVEVRGNVEGATILAQDNIKIYGNMCGGSRGMLSAGGLITCKNIEQGTVNAGVGFKAETALHSNIKCKGEINISGLKSKVVGGNLLSSKAIIVNECGNSQGTPTNLIIGYEQNTYKKIQEINKEVNELQAKIKKQQQLKQKAFNTPNVPISLKVEIVNKMVELDKTLQNKQSEVEKLVETMDSSKNGKIEIRGTGHNGVKVTINGSEYLITKNVEYTSFKCINAEIKQLPCS